MLGGLSTDGAVSLFPVWVDRAPVRGLTTGVAARVSVFELADDPEVERVTVRNDGTRPALLLEGELVEGGLQTRACATT